MITLVLSGICIFASVSCHKKENDQPTSTQWVRIQGIYGQEYKFSDQTDEFEYSVSDSISSVSGAYLHTRPSMVLYLPPLKDTGRIKISRLQFVLTSAGVDRFKGLELDCTITEFGKIGGLIKGSYSGNVRVDDLNYDTNPDVPVTGDFQVIRKN